jgi:polyhydroxyalkanoate synthesis regulator phasin
VRIPGQEDTLGRRRGGAQVDDVGVPHGARRIEGGRGSLGWVARRPTPPKELPDSLREAVERTVEATLGSAGRSREAAQGALDDVVQSVDELRREAEQRLARSRRSMAEAIEGRRPASYDDIRQLKAELRAIGRRLDAIEERLPAKRAPAKRTRSS